jgi:1,4-alpha-glucan branching enzyme
MRRITMSNYLKILITLLLTFFTIVGKAQNHDILRMEEGKMILRISTNITQQKLDSVLKHINMMRIQMDSIRSNYLSQYYLAEGWQISKQGKDFVELSKNIQSTYGKYEFMQLEINSDSVFYGKEINTFYPKADFGVNTFKNRMSVLKLNNGRTRFLLYQKLNANKIYLSGSFNAWAIEELQMFKTDTAWYCDIDLKPGKHLYKFIVDGDWMNDPENKQKESDTYNGYNSVYFECNYVFKLNGYSAAKKVILAGSFNNWEERELNMQKINGVWQLPVYIKDGTHAYKFIVDRNWITDPANTDNRDDGFGNMNSFISIGKPTYFILKGFENARNIYLAGEFNEWRATEIKLQKNAEQHWQCSYVLAPGNYQYKYVIDGNWYVDGANSLKVVEPNYTFKLKGFQNAKDVRISGSFLNWPDPGIVMTKSDSDWYIHVYLPEGKHLYKYIIDGQWIIDPTNPLFEQNEHNTGNSFIWVK